MQRILEMMQSLPLLVLAIIMAAALGPSLQNTIIAIAIPLVPTCRARHPRQHAGLREQPFVEAAKAIGMSEKRIAIRHVLPNTLAPLIVLATAQLGSAILIEASLSFLGLGVPEPHPSWGRMLSESAAEYVRTAPWLVIFPGVAISFVVFGTNLLGDALARPARSAAAQLMNEAADGRDRARGENLQTVFFTAFGLFKAVDDVSFAVRRGETLAIVGESGCGKTMTALSLLRLVPNPPGRIVGGSIKIDGRDMVKLDEAEMRAIRGNEISMIFQEPMTSLNPVMTIGAQISETIRLHQDCPKAAAWKRPSRCCGWSRSPSRRSAPRNTRISSRAACGSAR